MKLKNKDLEKLKESIEYMIQGCDCALSDPYRDSYNDVMENKNEWSQLSIKIQNELDNSFETKIKLKQEELSKMTTEEKLNNMNNALEELSKIPKGDYYNGRLFLDCDDTYSNEVDMLEHLKASSKKLKEILNITPEIIEKAICNFRKESEEIDNV